MRFALPAMILSAVALAGCAGEPAADPPVTTPVSAAGARDPAARPSPPADAPTLTLNLADPGTRDRSLELTRSGAFAFAADGETADVEIADQPRPAGDGWTQVVLEPWVAVAHPRTGVADAGLREIAAILSGAVIDWAELGGAPGPISPILPAGIVAPLAASLDLEASAIQVRRLPLEEVASAVAATPGAVAVLPAEQMIPGVQALVIDEHDPYRDAWDASPLGVSLWIRSRDPALQERARRLLAAGRTPAPDPLGIVITGELIPARCSGEAIAAAGGFDAMFNGTRRLLAAADLAITPLEVSLTSSGQHTPCVETFALQADAGAATAIARAGASVVPVVGNHIMDCWAGCGPGEALAETLAVLQGAGLQPVGAGQDLPAARRPLVMETAGIRLAILAYDDISAAFYGATSSTPGTAPLDLETLAADVEAAAGLADHVIVITSWGIEYTADPAERQRIAARLAVFAGASLIAGTHPHWVQATELVDEAPVVYSLGNFVFDQDWSVETTQGVVLEVGLVRDRLLGYRLRPIVIRERHRPELVEFAEEGSAILERIWEAADRLIAPPAGFDK